MNQTNYHIEELLGVGTFGTVYKCRTADDIECCIKRIKLIHTPNLAANQSHFESIQQEIYLLQNLIHPRIIALYSYFYSNDKKHIHIVMEYAKLGPLSKILTQRADENRLFSESEIKKLFIDVLLGVEFLHMKNVIHKDIKPDNILICDDGRLKIADFGVSKITDIDEQDLRAIFRCNKIKEIGGTPLYMAPETLTKNEFTFGSDIWALGCILYELCMLKSPFHFVQTMDELIRCTLCRTCQPISDVGVFSEQLVKLFESMTTVDKVKRATINNIISHPLIVVQYYASYFDY